MRFLRLGFVILGLFFPLVIGAEDLTPNRLEVYASDFLPAPPPPPVPLPAEPSIPAWAPWVGVADEAPVWAPWPWTEGGDE